MQIEVIDVKIHFPNISQNDFDYAFECLEDCKQSDASDFGFNYPYFTPGGAYGKQWWQLDSSLALSGYKWKDRAFAERALLNFIESQQDDGRICLWGNDALPKQVAGGNCLAQSEGVSSLPKIFDVTYHILQGTKDIDLITKAYAMLQKYLDWWYRERLDKNSGLITAVFEETFIPYLGKAREYAPVDTNVEVYVGLNYTVRLAIQLGKSDDAEALLKKADALKIAINQFLWQEEKGAYYPFDIRTGKHIDCLMASTFYPLRMHIASKRQKDKLLSLLTDNEHFHWHTYPLTSVSKKDPIFQTTLGDYQGNASWSGNVWTLINEMVIRGLLDSGEKELAAELALKTIQAFNNNYSEFLNPFDGSGHGVSKYAWTASQYLALIIEVIFGICVNADKQEVFISPNLTEGLKQETLSITDVMVFDGIYLDVCITQGNIRYSMSDKSINIKA